MPENFVPNILNKYADLHKSQELKLAVERKAVRIDLSEKDQNVIKSDPQKLLQTYFERFTEILNRENEQDKIQGVLAFKKVLSKIYIDNDSIREVCLKTGNRPSEIQNRLEIDLNTWVDFLARENYTFGIEFNYIVIRSLKNMGAYDKTKNEYKKRSSKTISPYPELNEEALGLVFEEFQKDFSNDQSNPNYLLVRNAQFEKLYGKIIGELEVQKLNSVENKKLIEGRWVDYKEGQHIELKESLKGKSTGWCTATGRFARDQLSDGGEMLVYYTLDSKGEYVNPRVAIRIEGGEIEEIRGILSDQDLEPELVEIMDQKAKNYKGYYEYSKKTRNTRMIAQINEKVSANEDPLGINLNKDEVNFVYGIDGNTEGFGHHGGFSELWKIRNGRDIKSDFASAYGYNLDQIYTTSDRDRIDSSTKIAILNPGDDFVMQPKYQDLEIVIGKACSISIDIEGNIPEVIVGTLLINTRKKVIENGLFPNIVRGEIKFRSGIKGLKNVAFPEAESDTIDGSGLKAIKNVTFPEIVNGSLKLNELDKIYDGCTFPRIITGSLELGIETNSSNFGWPEEINTLECKKLSCLSQDLDFSNSQINHLDLRVLTNLNGHKIILPNGIQDLIIPNLKDIHPGFLENLPSKFRNLSLPELDADIIKKLPKELSRNLEIKILSESTLDEIDLGTLEVERLVIRVEKIIKSSELPQTLRELTLKHLVVDSDLPPNLETLRINELTLGGDQKLFLPNKITKLEIIKNLAINSSELPQGLKNLKVQYLNIDSNLPTNLIDLDVDNLQIPSQLKCKLPLGLNYFRVNSIKCDSTLTKLILPINLEALKIDSECFPECIKILPTDLGYLSLSSKSIQYFPELPKNLLNLSLYELDDLDGLSDSISQMEELTGLYLPKLKSLENLELSSTFDLEELVLNSIADTDENAEILAELNLGRGLHVDRGLKNKVEKIQEANRRRNS